MMPKDRASQSICPYGSQRNTICSTLDIRLVSIATIALLVLVGCATSGEHADSAAGGDDNLDPAVLNDTLGSGEQAAASLLNRQLEAIPRRELVVFTIQGKVKSVQDGDSLRITSDAGTMFSIRMSDIDTPEAFHPARPGNRCKCRVPKDRPGQPLADKATQSLRELAPTNSKVRAECYEIGFYGRPVCHVFLGAVNTNLEQIRRGWAMLPKNPKWIRDPTSVVAAEDARRASLGVWALDEPIHPSDWRSGCWKNGECPNSVNE